MPSALLGWVLQALVVVSWCAARRPASCGGLTPFLDRSKLMPTPTHARSADLAVLARDLADRACELAAFLAAVPNLSGEVLRQLTHALNDSDRALAGLAERIGQEAPAMAES